MPTPARIALITGASGGIGSAIARRFAAEGFRLALCGRNTEKLESVRASLPQGTEALLLPGDVNDAGYQDACLAAVQARFGGLDVLVNCAGMAQSDAFEDITPARFDEIMTLNCRTPFFLCQKALPLLRQSQAASILNIASVTAHKGYVRQAAYAADITYGTNNEMGFDYLRDNMAIYKDEQVQRGHSFAIVDEVDSILIDEARTPLIISGMGEKSTQLYDMAESFACRLKK